MKTRCTAQLDLDAEASERPRLAAVGALHARAPNVGRSKAVIRLDAGELHRYAQRAESLLADTLFVRGDGLVRICTDRHTQQSSIQPVTPEWLQRELSARADFYRLRNSAPVKVDCPPSLAKIICRSGDWPGFLRLHGISRAPFLRPDLSVCSTKGYDISTGIYCDLSEEFPPIDNHATRADALTALAILSEPFSEFPFASEASRGAMLVHILTAAARTAMPTSPAFFYTAPAPGTGKTLAARMAGLIASGSSPSLHQYTDDFDELRKLLYSALLSGASSLVFDNLNRGMQVRSSALCAFLTASTYADRKLGVSEIRGVANHCTIALTGNNLTPTDDLARRSIVIRLDANSESARGRSFKIDNLLEHVSMNRVRLLTASLTIIRAYQSAGAPPAARSLESFEAWSRIARDPLMWLGLEDPVCTQHGETDEGVDSLATAFEQLANEFPERFTAKDVVQTLGSGRDSLCEALEEAGCWNVTSAQNVGRWLSGCRGRVAAGLKLISTIGHRKTALWSFKKT